MKYKGEQAPAKSGIVGVKQVSRGTQKGKWRAFYKDGSGLIYSGIVRESKGEAMLDLTAIRARIYI